MTSWKVALNIPEDVILFPVRLLAIRLTLIGGFAFLLMLLTVNLLARRLAAPLKRLTVAAADVEANDYDAAELDDLTVHSGELGLLARGFQRMIREVDARQQRLKEAEEALRQSERHFRSLIEHASDVITILDKSGIVQYESPSIQRALGYAPEELVGRRFFEYVHPQDMAMFVNAFAAAPAKGQGAAHR